MNKTNSCLWSRPKFFDCFIRPPLFVYKTVLLKDIFNNKIINFSNFKLNLKKNLFNNSIKY